jgi:hypothetical protein
MKKPNPVFLGVIALAALLPHTPNLLPRGKAPQTLVPVSAPVSVLPADPETTKVTTEADHGIQGANPAPLDSAEDKAPAPLKDPSMAGSVLAS